MNDNLKIRVVNEYLDLLTDSLVLKLSNQPNSTKINVYNSLLRDSFISSNKRSFNIVIFKYESRSDINVIFNFFDTKLIYGRLNNNNDITLFWNDGKQVEALPKIFKKIKCCRGRSISTHHKDGIELHNEVASNLGVDIRNYWN